MTKQVSEAAEVELCEEDEIVVLEFKESLPIGLGYLSMEFDGTLNDRMKGFYRRYCHVVIDSKYVQVLSCAPCILS